MVPAAVDVQYESGWRLKAFRIPFSSNFLLITYLVSLINYRDFNIAYIYIIYICKNSLAYCHSESDIIAMSHFSRQQEVL